MTAQNLFEQICIKQSFLCIGLDTDLKKIPAHLLQKEDAIFEFNKAIIDATHDLCVAYKLNTAFYEAHGMAGWQAFEKTIRYIPKDIFIIADAKRGDIGNTSDMYATAFFKAFPCDAVTVAPYMGHDSVTPFLQYPGKWAIILGLTSNPGSSDFQMLTDINNLSIFEHVLRTAKEWGNTDNTMFVIGATHPDLFNKVRHIIPHHFLLVPGIGAQGGSLKQVAENGFNKQCGLLVNNSRQVIYASSGLDFAEAARKVAHTLQQEMSELLTEQRIFAAI